MTRKITVEKYYKPSLGKTVNKAGYERKVKDAPERPKYEKPVNRPDTVEIVRFARNGKNTNSIFATKKKLNETRLLKSTPNAEKIMDISGDFFARYNLAQGTDLLNYKNEFISEIKDDPDISKITKKDIDALEDNNFHTEIKIITEAGLYGKKEELKDETDEESTEPETEKGKKLRNELAQFTGTENYYQLSYLKRLQSTDGIAFLANEAQAFWLIDLIESYQPELKNENFQIWILRKKGDGAIVKCYRDLPGKPIITQEIEYTDFPMNKIKLYVRDGVLLLPSEY